MNYYLDKIGPRELKIIVITLIWVVAWMMVGIVGLSSHIDKLERRK